MALHPAAAAAEEAFLALAPFATLADAEDAAFEEHTLAFEAGACASHDAIGCPLCGWVM